MAKYLLETLVQSCACVRQDVNAGVVGIEAEYLACAQNPMVSANPCSFTHARAEDCDPRRQPHALNQRTRPAAFGANRILERTASRSAARSAARTVHLRMAWPTEGAKSVNAKPIGLNAYRSASTGSESLGRSAGLAGWRLAATWATAMR